MESIFVTFDVLKLDTSSAVRLSQLPNMEFIFVTFNVSKLDTSIAVRLLQLLNIYLIFVTEEVSTVHLSIDVTASRPLNMDSKFVIAMSAGLSHLHLPLASGVIVYSVPLEPLIFILKLPVAVPSMYSPPPPAAPPISLLLISLTLC